jgi:hypothetical protein
LTSGRSGPFSWTKSKPSNALATAGSKRSASVLWGEVAHQQPQLGNGRGVARRPARTRTATSGSDVADLTCGPCARNSAINEMPMTPPPATAA